MPIGNDSATITTVVHKEVKRTLEQAAKQDGRSLSQFVSILLTAAAQQQQQGPEQPKP